MDEFYEIADLANAPTYYEGVATCFNCGKEMTQDEVYKEKQGYKFCSIECYSVVFLAGE